MRTLARLKIAAAATGFMLAWGGVPRPALAYDADKYSEHPACIKGGVPQCLCEANAQKKGPDSIYVRSWKERKAKSNATRVVSHTQPAAPQNQLNADSLVLYFKEGETTLDEEDREILAQFLKQHPYDFSITLEGNADQCGSTEANVQVAQDRLESVRRQIEAISRAAFYHHAVSNDGHDQVIERNYDEQNSTGHHARERNVIIRVSADIGRDVYLGPPSMSGTGEIPGPVVPPPPHDVLDAMNAKCKDATTFMIDQSGSMSEHWAEIQMFDYPPKARLYMGIVSGCTPNAPLMQIHPGGDTNIWYELYRTIERTPAGGKVCMISDFDITGTAAVPLVPRDIEAMIHLLKERGVRLECLDITRGGAPYLGGPASGGYLGCPQPQ